MNTSPNYYIEANEMNPSQPEAERLYLSPEEFSQRWSVVGWMRDKVQLAREERSVLEVEIERTPFGKYVTALNVVSAK